MAVGLTVYVLRSADVGRSIGLVRSLGWKLPLLLLPNLAAALLEAVGWRASFARLGAVPRFLSLLKVRLVTEATMMGLPSGALISESLQPVLLKRRCGIPLETAAVASVGRKFFVVVSHGVVLAAATLLAWPVLDRVSVSTIGRVGLPWLLMATAAFMITAFGFGIVASAGGQSVERLRRFLHRVFGRWMGGWLERHAGGFQRADAHMLAFFRQQPLGLVAPMLLYCLGWVVRGAETLLFLHLLGVDLSLTLATVVETAVIVVRSVAVPVPAGLGVQDVGYFLSFKALGIPDVTTIATAFVLMKRGRDLFWVVVGFLLLGMQRSKPATP